MIKKNYRKILTLLICAGLLATGIIHCSATSVNKKIERQDQNIVLKNSDVNETQNISFNYSVVTFGPAYQISKIEFHEGPEKQINRINKFLTRWRLNPLIPVVFLLFKDFPNDLELCNASFTVTYERAVENGSRLSYLTAYSELFNDTNMSLNETTFLFNTPHSITVEDFNGIFYFSRAKLIGIKPAQFMLVGGCGNVTENPL